MYTDPGYVYDPWGRRVWTDNSMGSPSFEAYFYGATGQKLESYNCTIPANGELSCALEGTNTYFAGRMISEKGVYVVTDRLGSVRGDSTATNFSYFPWGEERGTTAHTGRTLFAGYYRDAVGQDYAMARYYNATTGAFWSQDPGSTTAFSPNPGWLGTVDPTNPTNWNRYAYALGDPVNGIDPTGAIACDAGDDEGCPAYDDCDDATCDDQDGGGGGGGCPVDTCVTVTAPADPLSTDPSATDDPGLTFSVTSQPACQNGEVLFGPPGEAQCSPLTVTGTPPQGGGPLYPGQNGQHVYNKWATRGRPRTNEPNPRQPFGPQEPPPQIPTINTVPKWKLVLRLLVEGLDDWKSTFTELPIVVVNPCSLNRTLHCGPYAPVQN